MVFLGLASDLDKNDLVLLGVLNMLDIVANSLKLKGYY